MRTNEFFVVYDGECKESCKGVARGVQCDKVQRSEPLNGKNNKFGF